MTKIKFHSLNLCLGSLLVLFIVSSAKAQTTNKTISGCNVVTGVTYYNDNSSARTGVTKWDCSDGKDPTLSPAPESTPAPSPVSVSMPTPAPGPTPTPASASVPQGSINSVDAIINDMTGEPDGRLHGVPANYSWASCKGGTDDPNDSRGFRAATSWGQLYEDAKGNPATSTRVQIRNIKTYVLSKRDNAWRLVQSSKDVGGSAFIENFSNNTNKPADLRIESDGYQSVTAGNGYNFHFWPNASRAEIDPGDMGGIFTTVQARVIGPDSSQAKYLLNMGGDWWIDQNAGWDNFKTNGGIGGGRCKSVKPEWQSFNMTTLSPEQIRKNPPPLD